MISACYPGFWPADSIFRREEVGRQNRALGCGDLGPISKPDSVDHTSRCADLPTACFGARKWEWNIVLARRLGLQIEAGKDWFEECMP